MVNQAGINQHHQTTQKIIQLERDNRDNKDFLYQR